MIVGVGLWRFWLSFMAPDSFSDGTKVYLIENIKEGNIKLLGTIGKLTTK